MNSDSSFLFNPASSRHLCVLSFIFFLFSFNVLAETVDSLTAGNQDVIEEPDKLEPKTLLQSQSATKSTINLDETQEAESSLDFIRVFSSNIIDEMVYESPSVRGHFVIQSSSPIKKIFVNTTEIDVIETDALIHDFNVLLELAISVNYVRIAVQAEHGEGEELFVVYSQTKLQENKTRQFHSNGNFGYYWDDNPTLVSDENNNANDIEAEASEPETDTFWRSNVGLVFFNRGNLLTNYEFNSVDYSKVENDKVNYTSHYMVFQYIENFFLLSLDAYSLRINTKNYSDTSGLHLSFSLLKNSDEKFSDHLLTFSYFNKSYRNEEQEGDSLIHYNYKWHFGKTGLGNDNHVQLTVGDMREGTDGSEYSFGKLSVLAEFDNSYVELETLLDYIEKDFKNPVIIDANAEEEKRRDTVLDATFMFKLVGHKYSRFSYSFRTVDNKSTLSPYAYEKTVHGLNYWLPL